MIAYTVTSVPHFYAGRRLRVERNSQRSCTETQLGREEWLIKPVYCVCKLVTLNICRRVKRQRQQAVQHAA